MQSKNWIRILNSKLSMGGPVFIELVFIVRRYSVSFHVNFLIRFHTNAVQYLCGRKNVRWHMVNCWFMLYLNKLRQFWWFDLNKFFSEFHFEWSSQMFMFQGSLEFAPFMNFPWIISLTYAWIIIIYDFRYSSNIYSNSCHITTESPIFHCKVFKLSTL